MELSDELLRATWHYRTCNPVKQEQESSLVVCEIGHKTIEKCQRAIKKAKEQIKHGMVLWNRSNGWKPNYSSQDSFSKALESHLLAQSACENCDKGGAVWACESCAFFLDQRAVLATRYCSQPCQEVHAHTHQTSACKLWRALTRAGLLYRELLVGFLKSHGQIQVDGVKESDDSIQVWCRDTPWTTSRKKRSGRCRFVPFPDRRVMPISSHATAAILTTGHCGDVLTTYRTLFDFVFGCRFCPPSLRTLRIPAVLMLTQSP